MGDESICEKCPFWGQVKTPLSAARYKDPAERPTVELKVQDDEVVTLEIPDPPKPFTRLRSGGIAVQTKDPDGNEINKVIYDYDLYPIRRMVNSVAEREEHVWHVKLPRGEEKDFVLEADALYDPRKFTVAIAHQGVYPHKSNLPYLQEYMTAYIAELQKMVDPEAQVTHLGWNEDRTRFILPEKTILQGGKSQQSLLTLGAKRSSMNIGTKGTLERQVELLRFYSRFGYEANQFFVLAGLASPIFFASGHHGVIVNASGAAGASKSTSLYTASSMWGEPSLYPINGTNNGATVRGRNERVTVLANLPICVDEITHMPIKDAVDLAMGITQPGHRIRLETTGVERAAVDSQKSTIMLTTANSSLHGMLSTDNTAGTAGSMRVFEIMFHAREIHQKYEADEFLHGLKENYGHVGEVFMRYVIDNLDDIKTRVRSKIKQVDAAAGIAASERFWSATIGTVLVAGEIAQDLGLLSYDTDRLYDWVVATQLPHMRGVVSHEYADPLAVLTNYLAEISGNTVVTERVEMGGDGGHVTAVRRKPHGAVLAHLDLSKNICHVLKQGFRGYCMKLGANQLQIVKELNKGPNFGSKIVSDVNTRRVLGAGTDYATAQAYCFTVNMAHPDVSGKVPLSVVSTPQDTSDTKIGATN